MRRRRLDVDLLFLETCGVGLDEENISILDDVILALLFVLSGGLYGRLGAVFNEIGVRIDLGADESIVKVGVNDARSVRGFRSLADGPTSHFIRPTREKVDELKTRISRFDDA